MNRDYKKEYEKEKESKVTKTIKLDKKLYNSLKLKLNNQNKTFTSLVNEKIDDFLKEDFYENWSGRICKNK